jgi:hypothetical protein
MDFHGEKTTAFCSPTLKTFQKKKWKLKNNIKKN